MEKGQPFIPSQRECSAKGMPVQGHLKCAYVPAPCPAQWCSTQVALTALSLSHHFLPTFSYDPPGLYRNGCPVSWKMQNSPWTQNQKDSGIPNVPPAQAAPVETGKALKCLQQGTMHSNPSSSTAARWRPLVRLRPDLTSRTKTSAPQWTQLWWQHPVQRPSRSDFQDKKQLMFVWAAQPYGGARAAGACALCLCRDRLVPHSPGFGPTGPGLFPGAGAGSRSGTGRTPGMGPATTREIFFQCLTCI